MKHSVVFHKIFLARIAAIEHLIEAIRTQEANVDALERIVAQLEEASGECALNSVAVSYAALADLLKVLSLLIQWRSGVLNATSDANRFLIAAKERYKLWENEYRGSSISTTLLSHSLCIKDITDISDVIEAIKKITSTPLPVPYFEAYKIPRHFRTDINQEIEDKEVPLDLAVAFVQFLINGVPATDTHFLKPQEAHDLEMHVRVSRWPNEATTLLLRPISIESPDSYDFPTFEFQRPVSNQPPFQLQQRKRALLKVAHSPQARPFEFKYTAEFSPQASEQPVAVVGQRTLRIESFDIQTTPITGYPDMDRKLLLIRDQLRQNLKGSTDDLNACFILMCALSSLACRAVQDGLFPNIISESEFQKEIRAELRRNPNIGNQLEEHAKATGGITDLSFNGIRIELKAEPKKKLSLKECERYIAQTASYVVGTGKRVGILCVLDCSVKDTAPFPVEEGLDLHISPTQEGAVCTIMLIIQGNLLKPSVLSR
jgi:hypothetical protein